MNNLPLSSDFKPIPEKVIEKALEALQAKKDKWVALKLKDKISILDEAKKRMLKNAGRWVTANIQAKGVSSDSFGEGEEWLGLAIALRAIRLLRQSLTDIQKLGRPRYPGQIKTTRNGQAVVKVFPKNWLDKLLLRRITGEIWMQPGITPDMAKKSQASIYSDKSHRGSVCLILGAGNQAILPVIDSLYKLFIEDKVVLLKINPVNAYMAPIITDVFETLIDRGFMQITYGGVKEGAFLCRHEKVDEIHLTGSNKTFDAIVFGSGQEGIENKKIRRPILTKPQSAELGNVTPVIIVPGPWSYKDIQQQAIQIASWLVSNAGFNCLTPRVIIQHKNWGNRYKFIAAISNILKKIETRKAYYPGAKERHRAVVFEHPEAQQFGGKNGDRLPWTLISNVDAENKNDICFKKEAFCGLLAETALEASNTEAFIARAVEFANETLWGTLTSTIIVHPKSLKDPKIAAAIEQAIAELRYGSVCINLRAEYAYAMMVTSWGAFPGHNICDIQSGKGVVNNFLMFESPQKSIVRGPFKIWPDPTNITSNHLPEFGKALTRLEASPSPWRLACLIRIVLQTERNRQKFFFRLSNK